MAGDGLDDTAHELQRRGDVLLDKIAPILRGHDPQLQGFVCAELMAMHIAGWSPEARDEMLASLIGLVECLIPFHAKKMELMRKAEGNA